MKSFIVSFCGFMTGSLLASMFTGKSPNLVTVVIGLVFAGLWAFVLGDREDQ